MAKRSETSGSKRALRCIGVGVLSHEEWRDTCSALSTLARRCAVGVVVLVVALLALNAFAASMGYGSF